MMTKGKIYGCTAFFFEDARLGQKKIQPKCWIFTVLIEKV